MDVLITNMRAYIQTYILDKQTKLRQILIPVNHFFGSVDQWKKKFPG